MSIRDRLAYLLFGPGSQTKSNPVYSAMTQYRDQPAPTMPRNTAGYIQEGYRGTKTVFRVIGQISRSGAGIKWKHYYDRTKKREYDSSPLLDLWNNPNDEEGGTSLREKMLAYYCMAGNNYLIGINAAGNPKAPFDELWTLRPDLTKIHLTPTGPDYYEYGNVSPAKQYPKPQVMHTKLFAGNDDVYGLSPIEVAAFLVDIQKAGQKWNLGLMNNMAKPGGAWTTDQVLNDNDYKSLKKEIREKFSGPRNAGETVILHGGVKWQALVGMTPVELDWLQSDEKSDRDIAGIFFNFPTYLLGLADSTFNNQAEAKHFLYTDIIFPIWDKFVDELNRWLVPRYGGWLDYDKEDVETIAERLQDAKNMASDRAVAQWEAGLLTWNAFQEVTGNPPVTGNDVIWLGGKLLPVDALGEIAAQNAENVLNPPPPPPMPNPAGLISQDQTRELQDQNGNDDGRDNTNDKARQTPLYTTKALNLRTAQSKRNYFDAMEQARESWIDEATKRLQAYFSDEKKTIIAAIDRSNDAEDAQSKVEHALTTLEQGGTLRQLLVKLYQDVGSDIGSSVYQQIMEGLAKKHGRRIHSRKSSTGLTGADVSLFAPDVLEYLLDLAGTKVSQISETQLAELRAALEEGYREGESIPELSQRIDDVYLAEIIPNRSTTIARTEVVAASNYGSQQGAIKASDQTGVGVQKVWLATEDSRTRPAHAAADGQKVDLDKPFSVDGEDLMFPGDPSGSAGNVANCRCTEYYESVDEPEPTDETYTFDDTNGLQPAKRMRTEPRDRDEYLALLRGHAHAHR